MYSTYYEIEEKSLNNSQRKDEKKKNYELTLPHDGSETDVLEYCILDPDMTSTSNRNYKQTG